mgnify:CR=1 FL=1
MPHIKLLKKEIAELIAAGEVVERPASVAKELIENSIDAGATHITVEIRRGGISLLRITDNGCGMANEDVPIAFLRHATSKIRTADDLYSIASLGFRGEALAATCAVSRVELITRQPDSDCGTHYMIEGGEETLNEETGCAVGTTIIVNDLFYNTPARMKFLKKDVSEGNAVAAVVDRAALSHPEIAFKFIRDGKQTLSTPGDGKLESAVYSVLGREFAGSVIPVSGESAGVRVSGLICRPVSCRSSRSLQFTFLNGRFVQSGTVTAAVEQAYRHSIMVGKFPAFVLNVGLPFGEVDVNVHPAKTQVRFSDERRVFEAVYSAVKSALSAGDTRPQLSVSAQAKRKAQSLSAFSNISTEYRQQKMNIDETPERISYKAPENKSQPAAEKTAEPEKITVAESSPDSRLNDFNNVYFNHPDFKRFAEKNTSVDIKREPDENKAPTAADAVIAAETAEKKQEDTPQENQDINDNIRFIGEAFSTYIIAEMGQSLYLIDKHAAHERILFEQLRKNGKTEVQQLLAPVRLTLAKREYSAAIENMELLAEAGFEVEDFGNGTVLVRSVPAALSREDVAAVCEEAINGLVGIGKVDGSRIDDLYHMIACKAATKGGYHSAAQELKTLAERILSSRDIMYCPHGRPVAFELKRRELEKQFGRIQ